MVMKCWAKEVRGQSESLPEVASNDDPFQKHYNTRPTPPPGTLVPGLTKNLRMAYDAITETFWYGPPQARSIFIPNSLLLEWKSVSEGVSTNDLIQAWLIKSWASAVANESLTVSILNFIDLRKHLPEIVPKTYLRNASPYRISPRALKVKDIKQMTHIELAKICRSFVKHSTSPEAELNYQSYEFDQREKGKNFRMLPKANCILALTSGSLFNLPQLDFGRKVECFEGIPRTSRPEANIGAVWVEDEGARIVFWMNKRKWNRGVWKSIHQSRNLLELEDLRMESSYACTTGQCIEALSRL